MFRAQDGLYWPAKMGENEHIWSSLSPFLTTILHIYLNWKGILYNYKL